MTNSIRTILELTAAIEAHLATLDDDDCNSCAWLSPILAKAAAGVTVPKLYVMKNHRASDTTLNYSLWRVSGAETQEAEIPLAPDVARYLFVNVLDAQLVSPMQAFHLGLIGRKE